MSNSFNFTTQIATASDISQYKFVNASGAENTTAGGLCIGVSQFDTIDGQDCTYAPAGVTTVMADGSGTAITRGALVASDASGFAVVAAAGDIALGVAIDPTDAANSAIRISLQQVEIPSP